MDISAGSRDNPRAKARPAIAVGALVGFYRRRRGLSQGQLADAVSITSSSIATFESGQRLPSERLLQEIGRALGLSQFALHQLSTIAQGAGRYISPADDWILPEDVIGGTPVFLRDLESESLFQAEADIDEMWIVTARPLALAGEMNRMLRDRIRDTKTTFVYFIDSGGGESAFRALWDVLSNDETMKDAGFTRETIWDRLKCVLSPPTLCLQHFGICNPGQFNRTFGRIIVYSGGLPIGYTFMDSQHVTRAYNLLQEAFELCKSNRGRPVSTDNGRFKLVDPLHPDAA